MWNLKFCPVASGIQLLDNMVEKCCPSWSLYPWLGFASLWWGSTIGYRPPDWLTSHWRKAGETFCTGTHGSRKVERLQHSKRKKKKHKTSGLAAAVEHMISLMKASHIETGGTPRLPVPAMTRSLSRDCVFWKITPKRMHMVSQLATPKWCASEEPSFHNTRNNTILTFASQTV